MSTVSSIFDYILLDTDVTDLLASYDFGGGDVPAIFTVDPIPEDSPLPAIMILQTGGSIGTARDRTHKGGEITIDIKVWGDKGDSEKSMRTLADKLWLLLDRAELLMLDFEFVNCVAEPPQRLSDPDGFPGFWVPLRVLVRV